jgi:indolepyruvate ferredoxin oxidoreductase beta subunit
MRTDIIVAGVGGQGVLSVASILAEAARREGLTVKQSEIHGMAQRGGAVQATLRLADGPIASELVPRGSAGMILGMEPVESLRYLDYLAPDGVLITAADPMINVPDYPPIATILERIRSLGGLIVEASRLARQAGTPRAANVVMVGAASTRLPLPEATIAACVREAFARKGDRIVEANLSAFRAGRAAVAPAAA